MKITSISILIACDSTSGLLRVSELKEQFYNKNFLVYLTRYMSKVFNSLKSLICEQNNIGHLFKLQMDIMQKKYSHQNF